MFSFQNLFLLLAQHAVLDIVQCRNPKKYKKTEILVSFGFEVPLASMFGLKEVFTFLNDITKPPLTTIRLIRSHSPM